MILAQFARRREGVAMTEVTAVEAATTRLERALQGLEEAVDCRLDQDHNRGGFANQVHTLEIDRSRLASDLDHAAARARRLENANRAVAARINGIMESIRGVIAGEG
jgi:hypothetical protein